ncbi:MAG: hypothetical protein IJ088_00930 [Clostridia bacterium]|nr:hypothetical protein [Clostridia bacterium]
MFTDIHHHIVYGVDDGAPDFETAVKMLRLAVNQGVSRIICTSHADPSSFFFDTALYRAHLKEEQQYIKSRKMNIELAEGCEIMWMESVPRLLQEGKLLTLNRSRYVLVEFYPDEKLSRISNALERLCVSGYAPVLAHAERYRALRPWKRLRELRNSVNVVVQMNASTILRIKRLRWLDDRTPLHFLSEGLVDIAATDSHNVTGRPCRMRECYEELSAMYGKGTADEICIENPNCIWNDDYFE